MITIISVISLVAISFAKVAVQPEQPSSRSVTVSIHVQDDAGNPIPKVPLIVSVDGMPTGDGCITDASGDGITAIMVAPTAREIVVKCSQPVVVFDPRGESTQAVRDFISINEKFAFKQWYSDQINVSDVSKSITIVAPRAKGLKGKVVLPSDIPLVIASHPTGVLDWIGQPSDNGNFTLGGFQQGTTTTFFIQGERNNRVLSQEITVPATVSGAHIIIPDISWPAPDPLVVPIDIIVEHTSKVGRVFGALRTSVSLISNDASHLYSFRINPLTGKAQSSMGNEGASVPKVAPGTYYVCVGSFTSGGAELLFQPIKDGRIVEVEAAGLPKIVVPTQQTGDISLTIDAESTWTKMRQLNP